MDADMTDPTESDPHAGHDHGNCDEALHELYTFLDGELTDARRSRIRHHLDDCSPCLEVFDFEAELRIVIKQKCQEQVPESLRQRIFESLASADAPPAADALPGTASGALE
jgi:mycothiol system anti-sigma-R factor